MEEQSDEISVDHGESYEQDERESWDWNETDARENEDLEIDIADPRVAATTQNNGPCIICDKDHPAFEC